MKEVKTSFFCIDHLSSICLMTSMADIAIDEPAEMTTFKFPGQTDPVSEDNHYLQQGRLSRVSIFRASKNKA
jgi:hypothetical protein